MRWYFLNFFNKKTQPDFIVAAGEWILNPRKHFSKDQLRELLPKIDKLNKGGPNELLSNSNTPR